MPITQNKYINIVSAVSGGAAVSQRELIGRVFTTSYLVPTNSVVEFGGGATIALQEVGNYFGLASPEYAFASKYFGFVSKKGIKPKKIGFARYSVQDTPAMVIGGTNLSLSALQSITTGTLSMVLNGNDIELDSINLSTATSFADVATALSEKMESSQIGCTYDADKGRFAFSTTDTGAGNELKVNSTPLAVALGMVGASVIVSDGASGASITQTVSSLEGISNNFFSFTILGDVSTADLVSLGTWVNNQNIRYMLSVTVNPDNAVEIQDALAEFDGVCLTLDIYNENAGFMPMAAIAAIDYTRPNAGIDMMYQQFPGVQPSVDDFTTAKMYDAIRVNYYGATQQAGQAVSFYQDGVLQGSVSSIGVFANEAWLKDSFFTNLLNLRIALDSLPASNTGKALVMNVMSETIELAKYNGTIMAGKMLDSTQKAAITEITGNVDAWMDVQSNGYWMDASVEKYTENGIEKYKISYLLVYAKGDSINFIDGRDILI